MKCCFCKKDAGEYGNNANPIMDARCCDACNEEIVIPFRLMKMHQHLDQRKGFKIMVEGDFTKDDVRKFAKFLATNWKGRKEHINCLITRTGDQLSLVEAIKIIEGAFK